MIRRLALLLLLAVGPAAAREPALVSLAVDARLEAGRATSVAMRYRLEPRGAEEVFLSALTFDEGRVANVRAFSGTRELSFQADSSAEGRLDGVVAIPTGARSDRWELRLEYEVLPELSEDSSRRVVVLPLLVAGWPPEQTSPGTFRADVHLHGEQHLESAFPASFEAIEPVERTSAASAYRFELPVVPSLIRLRLAERPSLLTLESVVDLATIGVLVLLASLGWRRLRESWA